jgi:hypothetical protein
MLDLVLRLARPQRFRQIVPEFEEPPVQHLQDAADISRAVAVEIERGQFRIRITRPHAIPFPIQKFHRHQSIKEIADAPGMHPNLFRQLRPRQFPIF